MTTRFGRAARAAATTTRLAIAAGAVALALGFAGAALAQPFPTPPPPAAPRPFAIDAPTEARLDNGLRVVVARRSDVPLVSAELVVLSGSEADPPRLAGLASLAAALVTQGTTRRGAPQIAAAAEALGGSLDAGAGWNQSTLGMTVTTPALDAALALIAEVAREPAFAPAELERVRMQSLDAMKVSWSEPRTIAALVGARLSWGAGAHGHPAGGTPESLPRIGRADLVAAHRAAWRPGNAVLVFAGDVDPAAALALAQKHFGSWRGGAANAAADGASAESGRVGGAANAATAAVPARGGPATVAIDMPRAGQAAVVVDIALPERDARERATADVLGAVLGGGYSSRLNLEVRVRRGLSYGAGSGIEPRRGPALLHVSVQTRNDAAIEVARLVDDELDRLIATPVPADELAARKATLIGGFGRTVETTAGLAAAIRSLVVAGRSPAELTARIGRLDAVSAEDVQRYAAAHLGPAQRRMVVAGDAATFAAGLAAARPGVVSLPLDRLDLDGGGTGTGAGALAKP